MLISKNENGNVNKNKPDMNGAFLEDLMKTIKNMQETQLKQQDQIIEILRNQNKYTMQTEIPVRRCCQN